MFMYMYMYSLFKPLANNNAVDPAVQAAKPKPSQKKVWK
jgi:hypothetical protein